MKKLKNLYIFSCLFAVLVCLMSCENPYNPPPKLLEVEGEKCVERTNCTTADGKPNGRVCECEWSCLPAAEQQCSGSDYFCAPQCSSDWDCVPGTTCDEASGICVTEGVTAENEGTCGWDPEQELRVYVQVDVPVDVDVDIEDPDQSDKCDQDGRCERGENFANCPSDCFCDNDGVCERMHGENEQTCPNDCDTSPEDYDNDNDGYDRPPHGEDCDDSDPAVHPGATEVCNGVDDDCDGLTDEGGVCDQPTYTFYRDADQDGYTTGQTMTSSSPTPPAGWLSNESSQFDCDDSDPAVYPGAVEVCNQKDDDCDGLTDEGGVCPVDHDLDNDGYDGEEFGGDDCDDSNPAINPGATEICNDVDDDCDGLTDEGGVCDQPTYTFYRDADQDGYTTGQTMTSSSPTPPAGWLSNESSQLDCDDSDPAVYPGAVEVCNQKDDDCDGLTDEGDVCGGAECGDGNCDPGETHENCPEDCPSEVCDHDGVIDPGEECDSTGDDYTNLDGKTCADFGFSEGALYCYWDTCTFSTEGCWNPSPGEVCDHDGVIDPGEECDSTGDDYTNLDGKTCADFGYDGGELYCYWEDCTFSYEACWHSPVPDGSQWVARKDGGCIEVNPLYMSNVDADQTDVFFLGDCPQADLVAWENSIQLFDDDGDGWPEYCPADASSNDECRGNARYFDPAADNNYSWAQFEQCCDLPNWEEVCGPFLHCGYESQQDGSVEYVGNIMFNPATCEGTGYVEPR